MWLLGSGGWEQLVGRMFARYMHCYAAISHCRQLCELIDPGVIRSLIVGRCNFTGLFCRLIPLYDRNRTEGESLCGVVSMQ